ncbi:hypothetical protein M0813_03114 [Anaeramoeba flamelloides]|uniref:Uncharacterized protein n=1 Tax=Anaeramoeba flamelloides TaxID=1746091 RepID=A0ABQ8Y7M3_9EUKA|nr:hypothetical protein M0813_03114 [Anaeramoeba flamelloides]
MCNFLYGDDKRCAESPYNEYCGNFCQKEDGSTYCRVGSCDPDPYASNENPVRCEEYSDLYLCNVCIERGCKYDIETEKCNSENGTAVPACETHLMTDEECQKAYRNYKECSKDTRCVWAWLHGNNGPNCYKDGIYNMNNANIYSSSNTTGDKLCELRETCDLCKNAGCSWCYNSTLGIGYCTYDTRTVDNTECRFEILEGNECPNDEKDNVVCIDYDNCYNCSRDTNCDWCTTSQSDDQGKCIKNDGICETPNTLVTQEEKCPAEILANCEKKSDCEKCGDEITCKWCFTDTILYTGVCLPDYSGDSVDECEMKYQGDWEDGNCQDPSDCLSNDCDTCLTQENQVNCEYCYLGDEGSECLAIGDCSKKDGTKIDNCEKDNKNTYECETQENCEDCFSGFPWCQWRHTGSLYQYSSCVNWNEEKPTVENYFDVSNCEPFSPCVNRTDCTTCTAATDDQFECVWCQGEEQYECIEYRYQEEYTDCVNACNNDDEDDESSSPASRLMINFFYSILSLFFFYTCFLIK